MPFINGGGGGSFTGGTVHNPVVLSMDTVGEVPLALQPATGDTGRDLIEWYDPNGVLLGWVDATGALDIEPASVGSVAHILKGASIRLRNADQNSRFFVSQSGHIIGYITGGNLKIDSDDFGTIITVSDDATNAVLITNLASSTNALNVRNHSSNAIFTALDNGRIAMPLLPTSDPGVPGQLYSTAGVVKISL